MSIYRINPITGSSGFKVNVSDDAGGMRVVGVFTSENAAAAWINVDRGLTSCNDEAPQADYARMQ